MPVSGIVWGETAVMTCDGILNSVSVSSPWICGFVLPLVGYQARIIFVLSSQVVDSLSQYGDSQCRHELQLQTFRIFSSSEKGMWSQAWFSRKAKSQSSWTKYAPWQFLQCTMDISWTQSPMLRCFLSVVVRTHWQAHQVVPGPQDPWPTRWEFSLCWIET